VVEEEEEEEEAWQIDVVKPPLFSLLTFFRLNILLLAFTSGFKDSFVIFRVVWNDSVPRPGVIAF